jgi:poly-gamma-glutamate capsule biosynthesis protein CapA/YwtB (metallophosphatase superfamily)
MLAALLVCAASFSNHTSHDTLTVAMTGDIMMGTTYPTVMLPAHDGAKLFDDTKAVLRRADIAVGNLEGAICDGGKTTKEGPNSYAFRTPTTYGRWLKDAGYDFLSMANNHAHDFGDEGIASSEAVLREQGIKFAGLKGRVESAILERKGLKIGLCAFGHNSYTLLHTEHDLKTVGRIVDDLVRHTDIVVVSFHGGAEGTRYSHLPDSMETFFKEKRGHLRRLAHFCIDHGADIVYGHGPHVVRATEVYRGRFIAYSLGNFCTPYGMNLKGISGYAPVIEVKTDRKGRFLGGRIHSFIQQRGIGPRRDATNSVAHQIKALSEHDVPASEATIDAHGIITFK